MAKQFQVTKIRSHSGCTQTQIRTLTALGLTKKINSSAVLEDNLANRGQIRKVQHLVEVKVIGGK